MTACHSRSRHRCVCVCPYPPVKTYQPPSRLHTSEWEREHMKRMDGSVLEERDCDAGYEMEERVWHRKEIKSRKRGEEDNLCVRLPVWRTWTSSSLANYLMFLINTFDMILDLRFNFTPKNKIWKKKFFLKINIIHYYI